MKPTVVAAVVLLALAVYAPARADSAADEFPDAQGEKQDTIDFAQIKPRRDEAKLWLELIKLKELKTCFGDAATAESLKTIADDAASLAAAAEVAERPEQTVDVAVRTAVEIRTSERRRAEDALKAAAENADRVEKDKNAKEEAKKAAQDERSKAKIALDEAIAAERKAKDELALAEQKVKREAAERLASAAAQLESATALLSGSIGAAEFERLVGDHDRVKACKLLREKWLGRANEINTQAKAEAKSHAKQAFLTDLFRKAQDLGSASTGGTGLLDKPGAPDRVAFALMSGLGAESRTDGTRVIMTLNVASLFKPEGDERLALDTRLRHLFFQANLPITSTEDVPTTGTPSETQDAAPQVTRFTLKVGGSFEDDSDTRLPVHADCYASAWIAAPSTLQQSDFEATRPKRRELMSVCDRMAAARQRLAWRVATTLRTEVAAAGKEGDGTQVEDLGGALVWGPSPFAYIDLFFKHTFVTSADSEEQNAFGGGVSAGVNVGGTMVDQDGWARIGVDLFGAAVHHPDRDDKLDADLRISAVVRAKFLDSGVGSVALGPRFLASEGEKPGFLATVGLTWDADKLIDDLVSPAEPATP